MTTVAVTVQPAPWTTSLKSELDAPGTGHEIATVDRRVRELQYELAQSRVITYRDALLAETVKTLADAWRAETQFESSLTNITDHPAYRAIIDLGTEVLPILLNELRRDAAPWFTALREITGEDPVQPNQRGDMRSMADAWLRWGRQRRLIR